MSKPTKTPRTGRPRGENPSYKAWHRRLKTDQGRAADFTCTDCPSQARDWSYVYGCADELSSDAGPYCTHASHYVPRCPSCHQRFDALHTPIPELPPLEPPILPARTDETCFRGHPWTDENTYTEPSGRTACRTCRKVTARRSDIRKAERNRATWNLGGAA